METAKSQVQVVLFVLRTPWEFPRYPRAGDCQIPGQSCPFCPKDTMGIPKMSLGWRLPNPRSKLSFLS